MLIQNFFIESDTLYIYLFFIYVIYYNNFLFLQEIELIQQDNNRLQIDCDEMERLILESGESKFASIDCLSSILKTLLHTTLFESVLKT